LRHLLFRNTFSALFQFSSSVIVIKSSSMQFFSLLFNFLYILIDQALQRV
jgi:hypothetical protein